MENEILTIEEVAKYLRVSVRTVYDWAQKGEIPCGKMGTSWRFIRKEIENWANQKLSPRIKDPHQLHAEIKSAISPDRCVVVDVKNKNEMLNILIDLCYQVPGVNNRDELADAVFKREKLMSTGIGLSIAIPHVRLQGVKKIWAACAVNKTPLEDYESLDGKPVQIVIMIVAGRNQHSEYIQTLSKIVSSIKEEDVRKRLLASQSGEELYGILGSIS